MHASDEWSPLSAAAMIARPTQGSDKYSRGVLGVVTGSDEYPGAAVLGVSAALAAGVGMLRYLGPERPSALVLAACPEVVTVPGRVQAWLAGSGMADASSPLLVPLSREAVPVVLDAGALPLAGGVSGPVVITPHHRELARLLDTEPERVLRDPASAAREAAASLDVVVLLKGSSTIVATPTGRLLTCPPASPWLATAGTGDALAGILGALLATNSAVLAVSGEAQQLVLARLAASASVIHALAAQRASGGGPITVRALVAAIPATVAELLA